MSVRFLLSRFGVSLLVAAFLASGATPNVALGADGAWAAVTDGDWSTAGNWAGNTVADGSGNTAFFNAVDIPDTGITVSLDGSRTIGNLTFGDTTPDTAGSWTLSGANTLTLAGTSPTVTVETLGTNATTTIATPIVGNAGLTKAGPGALALTDTNNYTGGTTVAGGVLVGKIASILGDVQVDSGATVQFNSLGITTITTITNVITGNGVLRLNLSGTAPSINTYMNKISGFTGVIQLSNVGGGVSNKWTVNEVGTVNAALIVASGSQIFVNGTASFDQGITVSGTGNTEGRGAIRLVSTLGGNITLVGDTTIGGEGGTLTGNITSGAAGIQTLTFGGLGNGNATVSGAISDGTGTVALTQNRAGGTLKLTGNNSYSGVTTIGNGTVQVGDGGATGTLGTGNVVNNGALVFNRSNDLTVENKISGTGSLSKQGTGTLTLSGENSYSGGTTVKGGTLVGGIASIRGTVQVDSGATVQFNTSGSSTTIDNTIAGDGLLRLHLSDGGHTIMNKVSGVTGMIWVSNDGNPGKNKWSVTSPVTANAAVILDSGSTIFVSNAASFSKGITVSGTGNTENRGAIRLANTLGGNITLVGDTLIGGEGGTLAGNIASGIAGTQTLTFGGNSPGNGTISGAISDGAGTVALKQSQVGTLKLTGNNSYSGGTTIGNGTVQVGTGGTTGTLGTGNVVNNGALVFNRSNDLTVANQISGTGRLSKQGDGTLILTGTNTYGGATHIQGGTVRLAPLAPPTINPVTDGLTWSLDASDGSSINAGAPVDGDLVTIWTAGTGPTIGQETAGKQPTYQTDVQNGLSAIRFDGNNTDTNLSDRLFSSTSHADVSTIFIVNAPATQPSGSGGIGIVGGTGQGGTTLDKGIRRVGNTNVWQQTSPGSVDDFAYPEGSQIRVNGILTRAFAADEFHLLTATRNAAVMKFNAVGGYLDKRAYKGDVGELLAFNRILTAAEIGEVEAYLNAKWFGLEPVLPVGTAVTIDGGAGLEVIGLRQSIGSLAGASGSSVLLDNSVLVVGGNNASTVFAGSIGGDGGLTKTGTGVLTLSGASDYTGATTINSGTLAVTGSLGQTAVAVNAGGTLDGSGAIGGAVTVAGGGFLRPGTSPGVLAMGSLTLESGSTTVMEINGLDRGTEYDGVDIDDANGLAYGGTLSLDFGNTSWLEAGTVLDLFNFTGTATGDFSEVTSTGFYSGEWLWDGSDVFSLEAGWQTLLFSHLTGDLTIIPEPSTLALTILALIALVLGRPWRRAGCRA